MLISEASKAGKVEILVISMDGYLWFKNKKKKFSSKLTTSENVEYFSTLDSPEESKIYEFLFQLC